MQTHKQALVDESEEAEAPSTAAGEARAGGELVPETQIQHSGSDDHFETEITDQHPQPQKRGRGPAAQWNSVRTTTVPQQDYPVDSFVSKKPLLPPDIIAEAQGLLEGSGINVKGLDVNMHFGG